MVDKATPSEAEPNEPSRRLADDQFYRALAARPRRHVLAHLLAREECSVQELVDVLCGWETTNGQVVDAARAEQLHIELIHRHLPLLEEASLLSYDRHANEVAVASVSPQVERLVRESVEAE